MSHRLRLMYMYTHKLFLFLKLEAAKRYPHFYSKQLSSHHNFQQPKNQDVSTFFLVQEDHLENETAFQRPRPSSLVRRQ
jgi:hypothetical protein